MFATGSRPTLWKKIQSAIINLGMNVYYRHIIQRNNQKLVNNFFPEVPDLESLGRNISLVLLNQYFPLTGPRQQGPNIVEVGGMHVKEYSNINDKELEDFFNSAENGVVYISFGTVAHSFPLEIIQEIKAFVKNVDMKFVWKVDNVTDDDDPKNLMRRKWLPQPAILCHPKVVAFLTHSGMLSTTEAIHCGVPVIAVPLFGDQFSNAAAAVENGLGVSLDIYTLDRNILYEALRTILQNRYQKKAKEMSKIWRDRPLSPMDTAVFWVEYVAKHQGRVNLRSPTVDLNIIEYLMLDVTFILGALFVIAVCVLRFLCKTKKRFNKNGIKGKLE